GPGGAVAGAAPGCASSSLPRASPTMRSAALKLSSTVLGRWIVHTLSCASTERPIVDPVTQWLGSGFGHKGSTSKIGARLPDPCASTAGIIRAATSPRTDNTATVTPTCFAIWKFIVFPRPRDVGAERAARL